MTNPSTVPGEGHTKGLSELLAKVQAASGPDREIDAELASMVRYHPYGPFHWLDKSPEAVYAPTHAGWLGFTLPGEDAPRDTWASPEFTASIDAALALVDRVLSGKDDGPLLYARVGYWTADANDDRHYLQTFNVAVGTPPAMVEIEATGITEPLAILAATLSALVVKAQP